MNISEFRQKYPEYNDMPDADLAQSLYQKHYSDMDQTKFMAAFLNQTAAQPTPQAAPAPMGDPTAGSLDMFMAPGVPSEIGKGMVANAPAIGGAIGGGIGMLAPPISPLTAGLGMAAGGLVQRGMEGTQGTERQENKEMLTDFGVGLGSEVAGYGAGWLAQKLFAPAMGKIPEAARTFIDFAKSKGLPYSVTAREGVMPKLAQGAADYTGIGRFYGDMQRQKLLQGTAEAAADISKTLGLDVAEGMAGGSNRTLAEAAKGVRQGISKEQAYTSLDAAKKALGQNIELQYTMDAFEELGGYKNVLESLKPPKPSDVKKFESLASRLMKSGELNPNQTDDLMKLLGKNFEKFDTSAQKTYDAMRAAMFKDLEYVTDPVTGKTLATVKNLADIAYKAAGQEIKQIPLALKMTAKGQKNDLNLFWDMFKSQNVGDTLKIKDILLRSGKQDVWDAVKVGYVENVFNKTIENGVFKPDKYLKWWGDYGNIAKQVMPEHADELARWADISKGLMPEIKKAGSSFEEKILGPLILGGAGAATSAFSDSKSGLVVPSAFSLLAAWSVMGPGPFSGFARRYMMKEQSAIPEVLAPFLRGGAQFIGGALSPGQEGRRPEEKQ